MASPGRHRTPPLELGQHKGHGRVCCRAVRPMRSPRRCPAMYPPVSAASEALFRPDVNICTSEPHGPAEWTEHRPTITGGWAEPGRDPLFALNVLQTHVGRRHRDGAADKTNMGSTSRRHACEPCTVRIGARHDRIPKATTGDDLLLDEERSECRPCMQRGTPCEGTMARGSSAAAWRGRQRQSRRPSSG